MGEAILSKCMPPRIRPGSSVSQALGPRAIGRSSRASQPRLRSLQMRSTTCALELNASIYCREFPPGAEAWRAIKEIRICGRVHDLDVPWETCYSRAWNKCGRAFLPGWHVRDDTPRNDASARWPVGSSKVRTGNSRTEFVGRGYHFDVHHASQRGRGVSLSISVVQHTTTSTNWTLPASFRVVKTPLVLQRTARAVVSDPEPQDRNTDSSTGWQSMRSSTCIRAAADQIL